MEFVSGGVLSLSFSLLFLSFDGFAGFPSSR
jgi:hypothetical protein